MRTYVRIKFQSHEAKARWLWAIKLSSTRYVECTRNGDEWIGDGSTKHYLIGKALVEKPARMNLHYGWLEIVKPKESLD